MEGRVIKEVERREKGIKALREYLQDSSVDPEELARRWAMARMVAETGGPNNGLLVPNTSKTYLVRRNEVIKALNKILESD